MEVGVRVSEVMGVEEVQVNRRGWRSSKVCLLGVALLGDLAFAGTDRAPDLERNI